MSATERNINKTAGYFRHFLRLPNLVKMQFYKMKTFIPLKSTLHHIFVFFQRSKFFDFQPKHLIIRAEETFLRNNTIWYAFFSKVATFSDSEKIWCFFSKNPSAINFFSKENPNFECSKKSYYFGRILRQICYNFMRRIHIQKREQPLMFAWTPLANIGWKKIRLRGRFCFPYHEVYGAKWLAKFLNR